MVTRTASYKRILTNPLCGTLAYSFSLCCTDVMAPRTDSLFTRDLMLDAVPYSSANILDTRAIWSPDWYNNKISFGWNLFDCHFTTAKEGQSERFTLIRRLCATYKLINIPGGIMREIIDVPLPLAASRDLISFLTFQISTFLSEVSVVSEAVDISK